MKKNLRNLRILMFGLLIFSLIITVAGTCIAAEEKTENKTAAVYLSDLKPVPESSPYIADKDVEGNALQIKGLKFKKGLCVNSNSELIYRIDGKYSTFTVAVGPGVSYLEYPGKLTFDIYADGKKIHESKPLAVKEIEEISVKVVDVRDLSLRVNDDGKHTRFAIWGDASLY